MAEEPGKFDGASPEELEAYVQSSNQRPGESDVDWAQRVRTEEAALLARVAARREAEPAETEDHG